MRLALPVLACIISLTPLSFGGDPVFPDGVPASEKGGFMILRQGNQTTVSLGGVLFRRRVKVTTLTPEEPVATRFILPALTRSPVVPSLPEPAPAVIRVEIPDTDGLLYIDGVMCRTSGTLRYLESPPLPPGKDYPLLLRGVFKVGTHLLIEEKQLVLRAGESNEVTFDGSRAIAVPYPGESAPAGPSLGAGK